VLAVGDQLATKVRSYPARAAFDVYSLLQPGPLLGGFHNFPATDRVVYGKAAAEALSDEVARLRAKRVFLIASRTLNTKTDEIEKIRRALGDRYVATLDGIAQHTTRKQAANAAVAARDAKADLIVAIGGGSAIDLAKIVIMAMEHDLRDEAGFDPYVVDARMNFRDGDTAFRAPSVRQIAMPSTLNGGEYNAAALVTDERTKLKQIFFHPQMMPVSIILDPALTLHAPTNLWMGSGTRAMDHGIEALCSPYGTPLGDEVVLAGIRSLHDGMLKTLEDPADLEARRRSQYGSWLASFGLQALMVGPEVEKTGLMRHSIKQHRRGFRKCNQVGVAPALNVIKQA
jgi:maleylacetate reductase